MGRLSVPAVKPGYPLGAKMNNQLRVFCDIETTGLDPKKHEIISIAIIVTAREKEITRWELKVKPKNIRAADPTALLINGYNDEDWKEAIDLEVALLPIADLFAKPILFIGYNPGFDLSFLRTALESHGHKLRRLRMIDVMTLVHEHLYNRGLNKMSLDSVRDYMGLSKEHAHEAMQDVIDTKYIYDTISRSTIFHRLWWRLKYELRTLRK
jgi:DNA polymerase III alpha subunit (gram-positive type)